MPKTTVDEDDLLTGRKYEVGFARQVTPMQPEAVT